LSILLFIIHFSFAKSFQIVLPQPLSYTNGHAVIFLARSFSRSQKYCSVREGHLGIQTVEFKLDFVNVFVIACSGIHRERFHQTYNQVSAHHHCKSIETYPQLSTRLWRTCLKSRAEVHTVFTFKQRKIGNNACIIGVGSVYLHITRLHQFARSWLYNATAGGALW